jgi:hypothetical protein
MLPVGFVLLSVIIRLVSGGKYAWGIVQGRARPNPITWFLWGLTAMIAFFAQLQQGFTGQSFVLLALGITPLTVCVIALMKHGIQRYLTSFTLSCASIALVGIILWRITAQPSIAIVFSIIADIFASLPTLRKSYEDPSSEYPLPYLLSMVSMLITLLTIRSWAFVTYAFPLYMFGINLVLFSFAALPLQEMARIHLSIVPQLSDEEE